jgi:hypothetical protein
MQQLSDAVVGRSDAAVVGASGRSPLPGLPRSTSIGLTAIADLQPRWGGRIVLLGDVGGGLGRSGEFFFQKLAVQLR